jgi:hypothetical protein
MKMLFNLFFTIAVVSATVIDASQSERKIEFVATGTKSADSAVTIESDGSSLLRRRK